MARRRITFAMLSSVGMLLATAGAAAQTPSDGGTAELLAPTTPIAAPALDAGVPDAGVVSDAGVPDAGVPAAPTIGSTLPEADRPNVSVTIEPESGLRTGDVLHVRITADAAAGAHVTLPDEQNLGERTSSVTPPPVAIRATRAEEGAAENGRRETVFHLELSMLEPGNHTLGPFRVRVLTPGGQVGIVTTDPFDVHVDSVLGNEPDAAPRPPSEPVSVMEDDYRFYYVLAFLAALLLGVLLAWLYRRYLEKKAREPKPPPPPRPPWDVAAEQLSELAASRREYIESGRWDEWVDRLSDVVRGYLGARYEFEGLESTTAELIGHLEARRVSPRVRDQVRALMDDCDLVKFANSAAGDEETDRMLAAGMNMVRATRPVAGAPLVAPPTRPSPKPVSPADEVLPAPADVAIPETRTAPATVPNPEDELVPTPEHSSQDIPATRVVPDTVVEESPFGADAAPDEPLAEGPEGER